MADLMDPSQWLAILEGNRRLTLRTVKAFSGQDLFHYSPVAPMRPFAAMVKEFLQLEESTMRGIPTGTWDYDRDAYKEIATRSRPNVDRLQYALENEVHHRGQAFVYLRMLGIEPPAFYER